MCCSQAVDLDTGVAVGAWRKRAGADGLRPGQELTWAYKANASQFDLLYLYGFVSDHPSHDLFPLAVEWAGPSSGKNGRMHARAHYSPPAVCGDGRR